MILLHTKNTEVEKLVNGVDTVYEIACDRIVPNPSQPRREFDGEAIARLADSIAQYGILQPLTVRRSPDSDGKYELVAGERRLRAAKMIGLESVPCLILDVDGLRSAELSIIENIQRENLNMFEEAAAIAELIFIYKYTQEQVARRLSASQSYVANKLRLLRYDSAEREAILRAGLTERHARAMLRLPQDKREKAIQHVATHGFNVSKTEAYVEKLLCEQMCAPEAAHGKRKLILKDIRIFFNTIDRAVETVAGAGINITKERRDLPDAVELILRIPK
jgi:ParB family chromosome partitioning protein